jgi:hypothetical protein
MKIAVYTALCGPKSRLQPQDWLKTADGTPVTYLCFTDQDAALVPAPWKPKPMMKPFADPCRNAKQYKVSPSCVWADYDATIWVDANMRVTRGFDELLPLLEGHPVIMFKHFERDCLYDEANVCKAMGLDDPQIIDAQIARYREEGFPAHYGLPECCTILRKRDPDVAFLMHTWWNEIANGSRRDQLSFMYSVWKLGMRDKLKILDRTARDGYHHVWTPHISMLPLPVTQP